MKKFIFIVLFFAFFLTGCWDRKELNELGIVLAIGLDKGEEGEIKMTSQIVRVSSTKKEGGGEASPIEIITTKGDTIFDAIRNISKEFDRRGFFAHDKIVVIDETLAEEGLMQTIDFLGRSKEIRKLSYIVVAKGTTAEEILSEKHGIEIIQGIYLDSIIKRSSLNSKSTVVTVLDFIKKAKGDGINSVAGVMEIINQPVKPGEVKTKTSDKGIKFSGTSVFKKDKLVGYLDEDSTRGLNFILGKVKSGVINVPCPLKEKKFITIEITKAKVKIKPEVINDRYSFTVEIKEEGNIVEGTGNLDTSDLKNIEKLEDLEKNIIESEINRTINQSQKELGTDILGFGAALNRKYPKEWNKIEKDWDKIFPYVDYNVKVETKIRRTGLLQK